MASDQAPSRFRLREVSLSETEQALGLTGLRELRDEEIERLLALKPYSEGEATMLRESLRGGSSIMVVAMASREEAEAASRIVAISNRIEALQREM